MCEDHLPCLIAALARSLFSFTEQAWLQVACAGFNAISHVPGKTDPLRGGGYHATDKYSGLLRQREKLTMVKL